MADIKINGATPSAFYVGSTAATAVYYGSTKLWEAGSPTPSLPEKTIRCKFTAGYTPNFGTSKTLVDADQNIWDIYNSTSSWGYLLFMNTNLESIIAANTTGVTDMSGMCNGCTNLTNVPLFDTSSVTNMGNMFNNCYNVASGALALYQQASTQATPPTNHNNTFKGCGIYTTTGSAELAQIPASWGGNGA